MRTKNSKAQKLKLDCSLFSQHHDKKYKILLISYFGQSSNLSIGLRNPIDHLLRSVFKGVPEFFKHYYYYIYNVVYVQRKRVYYTIYVVSLCIQTAAKQRWFRIKYTYSNGVSNFNFLRARNLKSTKGQIKL